MLHISSLLYFVVLTLGELVHVHFHFVFVSYDDWLLRVREREAVSVETGSGSLLGGKYVDDCPKLD